MRTMIEQRLMDAQAENARLRAALDKIAGICLGYGTAGDGVGKIHATAVQALNEQSAPKEG